VLGVARAPAALPNGFLNGTVHVWRVLVPDLMEEVDVVRAGEERRPDRVDGGIAPTLSFRTQTQSRRGFFWFS